ncbi:MAG: phosphatase PAP2 family protein [Candidatus Riflebacteria bacterium]|nr:phosphatase PAP2 family protein [Candidatus Riflebacteria bacterium]
MPFISNEKNWIPLLAVLVIWMFFGAGGKYRVTLLLLALSIGASDQISSTLVKKVVGRKRPCCVEPNPRMLTDCKKSKSFPSSHAANTAAAAGVFLFDIGPRIGIPLLFLSGMISWSRVYIGVHYPSDVAAGMLLGLFLSWLIVCLRRRWFPPSVDTPASSVIEGSSSPLVITPDAHIKPSSAEAVAGSPTDQKCPR